MAGIHDMNPKFLHLPFSGPGLPESINPNARGGERFDFQPGAGCLAGLGQMANGFQYTKLTDVREFTRCVEKLL